MTISFIVLCYNDSSTIVELIRELDAVLSDCFVEHEIIAADDQSMDGSFELLMQLESEISSLKAMQSPRNLNVGGNFRQAVNCAGMDYIGYVDGDHQYDLNDIRNYIEYLRDYEVVTGDRVARHDNWRRKVTSRVFNYISNSLYGLGLNDINSGLKIFRAVELRLLPQWDTGAFYDMHIIMMLKHDFQVRIKEIPINHRKRRFGESGGASRRNVLNIAENLVSKKYETLRIRSIKNTIIMNALKLGLFVFNLTNAVDPGQAPSTKSI